MAIARINLQLLAIAEENEALFKMQDRRFEPGTNLVPPDIIIKRLEANRLRAVSLSEQVVVTRQELLKISRTLEVLNDKLRSHDIDAQRNEATLEIGEYISQLLGKAAS
ncbi:hypothetical protein [Phyllobacterium sp. SB3]|uniref:hypothetical protein n=1 Tax=Phyllobacterium sp. SB3 TaxID=3156073 RepID=UPI0032AFCAAE